jgi:hypothetical protein
MLYSTVWRMNAERERNLPIERRTCLAVSVKIGKAANNKMADEKWGRFYSRSSNHLRRDYPRSYRSHLQKVTPLEKRTDREDQNR